MNASQHLSALRELAGRSPGKRLPSIRELAGRWKISTKTVQEIVREAVGQGWLETRRGAGIWPQGQIPDGHANIRRLDAVQLAERIGEQIRTGAFPSNEQLPSPKNQSKLHGVHAATVRKAYGLLESEGLALRTGRTWRVAPPEPESRTRKAPVILCIGPTGADGCLRMESDKEWDFWREIQVEAIRCGLDPHLVFWDGKSPISETDAFWAVVSNWHMSDTSPLIDELQRHKIPTAVWVANEERLPGPRYKDSRRLWFHDLANGREAGRTMAEYIATLGHAKIAWISPFHGSSWSANRLQGMKDRLSDTTEIVEAVHGWISEWDVRVTLAWAPAVLTRFDLDGVDPEGDPDRLRNPVVESLTRQRCMEIFAPQLEHALASGATLWVASSDLVARWTLLWLASKGIRVPRDLALASFDDTREATRLDLTSLRFDVQGMARAMVRQVLSSRQEHRRVTRYTGQVVARGSTRGLN